MSLTIKKSGNKYKAQLANKVLLMPFITMKYLIALLSIFYLSSTVAFANCIAPNLDNNFLTPYETENQKWHVSAPYYYDDPDLGLGIKFKTSDITVDFYTFDFGIENFTTGMTDQLLQQSVSEMLQVLNLWF